MAHDLFYPILVGVILSMFAGGVAWARSTNRAVVQVVRLAEHVGELATDLRDLAGDVRALATAATDVAVLRAEFRAHESQANERWRLLGGFIPSPRYLSDDNRVPEQRIAEPAT